MKRKFKEPYQTFNELKQLSELGKMRYIVQEVKNKCSMRSIARELDCSPENISNIVKKAKKLKLY